MENKPQDNPPFNGFEQSNTTPVPDVLFDELLPELSGAELKVLLYIIRRTWGFKKATDAISLSQLQNGIVTKDGKVLDRGCGIKRRDTIVDALASLEKKGCIVTHKTKTSKKDHATTIYGIRFKNNTVVTKPDYPPSHQTGLPLVTKPDYRSHKSGLPVVTKPDPQETVIQQTELQQTEKQECSIVSEPTPQPFVADATLTHSLSSQSSLFSQETKSQASSKKKEKKTEPVEPKGPPQMPPADMQWGTAKCKQLFDAWRGHMLIGQFKLMQASTCAKGLAEQYSEEEVIRVHKQMNESSYWQERGGADICDVASQIHKEIRKSQTVKVHQQSPAKPQGSQQPVVSAQLSREKSQRNLERLRQRALASGNYSD